MNTAQLYCGDCTKILPTLPAGSVDCVITDPPYPEISRTYGRMTESDWHAMMDFVVPECRRILKPTGSAVFILQPNSERVGRMRPWLWEFMAKWTREWGMIQDAWWWNITALPTAHCSRKNGLMRPSIKCCVRLGDYNCYRNQNLVLWDQSEDNKNSNRENRILRYRVGGMGMRDGRLCKTADDRGGSTPFNVLPISGTGVNSSGGFGHGATTPKPLTDWWVRYICPPGGTVLDPFIGSGTVAIAALKRRCNAIGIDKMTTYIGIAKSRMTEWTVIEHV